MRRARGLLAVTGLAGLLLGGALAPAGATGAPATPAPATSAPATGVLAAPAGSAAPTVGAGPAPASTPSGVSLQLQGLSPPAVQPGDHLQVAVRVVNTTAAPLDAARVRLFVNSPVLTDRAAVQAWADGRGVQGGNRFARIEGAEEALPSPVPPGGSSDVTLDVRADQLRLGPVWGPRGVTLDVLDGGLQRLAAVRTFLVWRPAGTPAQSTRLTVLAPLAAGAPDVADGRPPDARVDALTAPGGRLTRVLQATQDPAVALALDPALLGSPAGEVPTARPGDPWRAQLTARAAGQEVLALPRGDPDVGALADAGADAAPLYRLAEQQGRASVQASLGAPARTDVAWPADGAADGDVLGLVRASGRTAVVLDASSVPGAAAAGGGGTAPARVTLAGDDAGRGATAGLLVDEDLSATFVQGGALTGGTPGRAAAVARMMADTAVVARGGTGRRARTAPSLLLAAPRDWDPDPAATTAELAALRAAPWIRAVPLADLLSTPSAATLRVPQHRAATGGLPADGLVAVAAAVQRARSDAGIITDPARASAAVASLEQRAVAAASSAWRGDQAVWRGQLSGLLGAVAALGDGVRVVPGSSVTVISSRVNLPVTLQNTLKEKATVVVSLRSASLRVRPQGPSAPVTVLPGARQRLVLPVRALASGDTRVSVVLTTTGGHQVGSAAALSVRVRADWEGRGVVGVAVLVVLVLVAGLVRTVRRVRRARRGPRPQGPRGPGAGGSTGSGPGTGGAAVDLRDRPPTGTRPTGSAGPSAPLVPPLPPGPPAGGPVAGGPAPELRRRRERTRG